MGLLRASLVFIIGNFSISLMYPKYINKINEIPIIGNLVGYEIQKLILENKHMTLLIIITLVEFIL